MPMVKFWTKLLLVVIFISHAVVTNVDGIPVKKKPPKIVEKVTSNTTTTKTLSKSTRPIKRPSTRDPRFLGKFSFVAGLHLPNPPTMSPIHRNDIVYKQHMPTQYVTTYNFPPSSWGPYAAAVYEPPPIPSFLEDPLGYLAAILNPYNWFNASFATTTNTPTTITTVVPDKNQDEVFVLEHDSDNEIPIEERMDNIKMKMGHEKFNSKKYITKRTPFELSTTARDYTTVSYEEENDADLVAEETTIKQMGNIRRDKDFEENSRQWFGKHTTQKTIATQRRNQPTEPNTIGTQPHWPPKEPHTSQTVPNTRAANSNMQTNSPNRQHPPPHQKPNSMNMTSTSNNTSGVTPFPTNTTNQTSYPLNNVTYPTYDHDGYYYDGYPQNVSHIELTTSKTPQIVQRIQHFNDVNQYLQPYQPNYHDFDEPPNYQNFDFASRFEQLLPFPNNYYDADAKFTFNNMNDNGLHGFKPSFPLHF